jgi:peptide/nickel transport system permease protein
VTAAFLVRVCHRASRAKDLFGGSGVALVFAGMVLAAFPVFVDTITRLDPVMRLKPPSAQHWFGTDHLGRDLLLMCLSGGRISMLIGVSVASLSLAVGSVLGLLTMASRAADLLLMRLADGLMAIPAILIAITLVSISEASVASLILALSVPEIPRVMRIVRSAVLSLREASFVEVARMGGCSWSRVLAVHMLPNTLPLLIVQGTYTVANAILVESGLSFIGLGVPAELPSWGRIIAEGRLFLQLFPYQVLIPGILLAAAVFAINVFGDRLRDHTDTRLQRSAS